MGIVDNFVDKKKAESQFISLEDGESLSVLRLKDIKVVEKTGFGGELKEVLRLICEVETSEGIKEKIFDNGTAKFAKELQEKGVNVGYGFTITRNGMMTKTKYTLSQVFKGGVAQNQGQIAAAPAPTVAAPAKATGLAPELGV